MDKIQALLDERIEKDIQNLDMLDGSQKSDAIDDLTKLYKLRIEDTKINVDQAVSAKELELKQKQANSQKVDRWINVGLQVGLSLASLIAYDIWFRRGLKFEETGSIGSPMTRNLLSRLIPKK